MSPIVFLDKDGTLVKNVPYNVDPAKVVLADGAIEGLRLLTDAGYRLAIVSNQSGVARALFRLADLNPVENRLRRLLSDSGLSLAGVFYCPHHPKGVVKEYARACHCRKPAPGLIVRAAAFLHARLADCWMIGDILDDVEAGKRAGCRTVLIDNGNETEWEPGPYRQADFVARDLIEAARFIVRESPVGAGHG